MGYCKFPPFGDCPESIIHSLDTFRHIRNPGGIRFGSAELYDVIDLCFAPNVSHFSHTIVDCLAVGQSISQGADERVILFVKLLEGEKLSPELKKRIRSEIKGRRTARHVPARVCVDL